MGNDPTTILSDKSINMEIKENPGEITEKLSGSSGDLEALIIIFILSIKCIVILTE